MICHIYVDIFKKSIITNVEGVNIPCIYIKDDEFLCTNMNEISPSEVIYNKNFDLTNFNIHWHCYYSMNGKSGM